MPHLDAGVHHVHGDVGALGGGGGGADAVHPPGDGLGVGLHLLVRGQGVDPGVLGQALGLGGGEVAEDDGPQGLEAVLCGDGEAVGPFQSGKAFGETGGKRGRGCGLQDGDVGLARFPKGLGLHRGLLLAGGQDQKA